MNETMKESMLKIAEGKTKIIWQLMRHADKDVYIESKDDITAGDGARHDVIPGKGIDCNITTCNMFKLLRKNNIPNHFYKEVDDRTFLAIKLRMISWEVVVRRVATGSYIQRHPEVKQGTVLNPPGLGYHLKCDKLHDPIIERRGMEYVLYDAHKPLKDGFIGELNAVLRHNDLNINKFVLPRPEDVEQIASIALRSFICIEAAWAKLNGVIKDMKLEFGYTLNGELILADVVDNASWRLEINGVEKSKQVYRDLKKITPDGLKLVAANYKEVADLSHKLA